MKLKKGRMVEAKNETALVFQIRDEYCNYSIPDYGMNLLTLYYYTWHWHVSTYFNFELRLTIYLDARRTARLHGTQ